MEGVREEKGGPRPLISSSSGESHPLVRWCSGGNLAPKFTTRSRLGQEQLGKRILTQRKG
ncbi:hypothetical protein E2C01_053342 [Portunus trituberculatus]|uniref:Uncharacterized protein n=1 Tax=Portunus trituberculatus TaxID=210409 RepID=A0A5B7GRS8_PORTR|nr:hypothetical protein [Portunus trituberculatus]